MNILITGGAGYIGSSLISTLQEYGHSVTIIDNFSLSNPRNLIGKSGYDFIRGDIRNEKTLKKALNGIDLIFHLAAITGAEKSHQISEKVFDVNLKGTRNLLRVASDFQIEKIVFASSCNVYGNKGNDKNLDENSVPEPINPYAKSKLEAEKSLKNSSIPTVILRLATNFGWSQGIRFNLVVNSFVFKSIVGEPLTVYGKGKNWRPFVHVQDTSRILREAINWDSGIYNIGMENIKIKNIASIIKNISDKNMKVKYLESEDPGPSYYVDFSKAKCEGLTTNYTIKQGIKDLIERFQNG